MNVACMSLRKKTNKMKGEKNQDQREKIEISKWETHDLSGKKKSYK